MSFEAAAVFFLAIFIFGITPGPGVFAIIAKSLSKGASSCWGLAVGMAVSDVIYLVLACFGLAAIASQWSEVFTAIRLIGAGYLIYLGIKMWRSEPKLELDSNSGQGNDWWSGLMQGFLISASNPKVILFYLAFLPTFMDLSALSSNDIILASGLTLVALLFGLTLIAFGAQQLRKSFKSEHGMRWLNRVSGSIMAAAGGFLIAN